MRGYFEDGRESVYAFVKVRDEFEKQVSDHIAGDISHDVLIASENVTIAIKRAIWLGVDKGVNGHG